MGIEQAVLELETALREQLVGLEFIKVNKLPIINGIQTQTIAGIKFKEVISEDDAEVWLIATPNNNLTVKDK